MNLPFLAIILVTALCKLVSEEGTVFREKRPLSQIPTGERYYLKVPLGAKFSIDLPSVMYKPSMWKLKHMNHLKGIHCTVKTVPILYTIAAQQEPETEVESANTRMYLRPARRVFTCWATKLTKAKLEFSYNVPMVRTRAPVGEAITYTVKVKVFPCKHPYH